MAYNIELADRVREILFADTDDITEKKMFGGLCFMVRDKMCVTLRNDRIMVRLDPDQANEALESSPGAAPMVHGGKLIPGFVYINENQLQTKKQLLHWIKMALEFNVIAAPSKKK